MSAAASFSQLVAGAMSRRGLGLRELCRRAGLDPSFFSKVLAGKRNPPSEEEPLRRLAEALELDPVQVIVAAGLIPEDWSALRTDADLVRAVSALARGRRPGPRRLEIPAAARPAVPAAPRAVKPAPPPFVPPGRGLSEELL